MPARGRQAGPSSAPSPRIRALVGHLPAAAICAFRRRLVPPRRLSAMSSPASAASPTSRGGFLVPVGDPQDRGAKPLRHLPAGGARETILGQRPRQLAARQPRDGPRRLKFARLRPQGLRVSANGRPQRQAASVQPCPTRCAGCWRKDEPAPAAGPRGEKAGPLAPRRACSSPGEKLAGGVVEDKKVSSDAACHRRRPATFYFSDLGGGRAAYSRSRQPTAP